MNEFPDFDFYIGRRVRFIVRGPLGLAALAMFLTAFVLMFYLWQPRVGQTASFIEAAKAYFGIVDKR